MMGIRYAKSSRGETVTTESRLGAPLEYTSVPKDVEMSQTQSRDVSGRLKTDDPAIVHSGRLQEGS